MSNIAYEGFCPNCHNFWIFCDCVDSFGTIGEDISKDEGAEEPDDDEVEVDDILPTTDNIDGIIVDPLVDTPAGPVTPGNKGSPLVPTVLFPTSPDNPVPSNPNTTWGAKNPTNTLDKPSYKPWQDVINDTVKKDKNKIDTMFKGPDFVVPGGKKQKVDDVKPMDDLDLIDDNDKLPGARLPPDSSFHYPVDHDDDDQSVILFDPPGDFDLDLDTILNDNATNVPKIYTLEDLHNGYSNNGVPEFLRPGHRGDVLRGSGMPVFPGPMYSFPSIRPANATPEEKNSADNLSNEYVDFLENELKPWLDNQSDDVKDWWDVGCKVISNEEKMQRGTTNFHDKSVSFKGSQRDKPNEYLVDFDDGTVINIRTDMDVATDFFDRVTKKQLESLLNGPNQDGFHEFNTEWNNGSPVISTRSRTTKNLKIVKFVSGVRKIVDTSVPVIVYDESGFDNNNDYYPVYPYVPPVPSVLTNNVSNTRRLTGDGTSENPFKGFFENYNLLNFVQPGLCFMTANLLSGLSSTQDNVGDALSELSWGSGVTNRCPLRIIHEMINEPSDGADLRPTFGVCSLQLQSPTTQSITLNVYSRKGTTLIYHELRSIANGVTTTIRPYGASSNVTISLTANTLFELQAFIICSPNETMYDRDQGGDAAVFFDPVSRFGDPGQRVVLKGGNFLIRITSDQTSYTTNANVSTVNGEDVGYGSIIPTSYSTTVTNIPLTLSSINTRTKALLFINPSMNNGYFNRYNASGSLVQQTQCSHVAYSLTDVNAIVQPFTYVTNTTVIGWQYFASSTSFSIWSFSVLNQSANVNLKERQVITFSYGNIWI